MREFRKYGFVRGVPSNGCLYRDNVVRLVVRPPELPAC